MWPSIQNIKSFYVNVRIKPLEMELLARELQQETRLDGFVCSAEPRLPCRRKGIRQEYWQRPQCSEHCSNVPVNRRGTETSRIWWDAIETRPKVPSLGTKSCTLRPGSYLWCIIRVNLQLLTIYKPLLTDLLAFGAFKIW